MLIAASPGGLGIGPIRATRLADTAVRFALLVLLLLAVNDASAAALSGLVTSVGLLAGLASLLAIKGVSTHAASGTWTAAGVVVLWLGVLFLWRTIAGAAPATWRVAGRGSRSVAKNDAQQHKSKLAQELSEHFLQLQAAWDANDVKALELLTTAEVLCELSMQLSERAQLANRTEFLALNVELIGREAGPAIELVCVEFSGLVRESIGCDPAPFRELWMLERRKQSSAGWRLAKQQTLL